MKILVPLQKKEIELYQEITEAGFPVFIPSKTIKVRVNRKSSKKIEKTVMAFRGLVFADVPDPRQFSFVSRAWQHQGHFVEVTEDEVMIFLDAIKRQSEQLKTPAPGDRINLSGGPLRGQVLIVDKYNKGTVWGHLAGTDVVISLKWVDNAPGGMQMEE